MTFFTMEDQPMEAKRWYKVFKMVGLLVVLAVSVFGLTNCEARPSDDFGWSAVYGDTKGEQVDDLSDAGDVHQLFKYDAKGDVHSDVGKLNGANGTDSLSSENDAVNSDGSDRDTDLTEEMAEQLPIFQKSDDGSIWYNSEPHNYTLKFPSWMNKKATEDDNVVLSGNALGKEELGSDEAFTTPYFTITSTYHDYYESVNGDFDAWTTKLAGSPDETVEYKGTTLLLTALDSGGPYARRAYVPIAMSGVVQLDLIYYTTSEIADGAFETKVKSAFYDIIKSTTELYLSM